MKLSLFYLSLCITSLVALSINELSAQISNQHFHQVDDTAKARYRGFEDNFSQFVQEMDISLKLRQDAKNLFKGLDTKLRSNDPIRADEQRTLLRKFAQFRDDRDRLEALVRPYNGYSDESRVIKFPVADNTGSKLEPGFWGSKKEILINPEDDLGRLIILEIKMWLAAKLMVIDNYAVIVLRYQNNADLHMQFDADNIDPEIKVFLTQVTDEILEDEKYDRISKIINLVQHVIDYELENPKSGLARSRINSYLNTLIESSYAYHRIPEFGLMDELSHQSAEFQNTFFDSLVWMGDEVTFQLSKVFGNAIGTFESRQGKMVNVSAGVISNELEPLDILLEKTPFRLTDTFIPGHWGHVAIWVGDKRAIPELKRLGVWDELPRIEAKARKEHGYEGHGFQSLIGQNHGVLEALRSGVELNTFEHFLNIDDLAVIRVKILNDAQKKTYLLNAFKQIGKAYDFNFDVETHREIVCSELAFVVFDDFEWPVEKSIGRFTVSPDNIATMAIGDDAPLKPLLIYHDGRKLPPRYLQHNLQSLLLENYGEVISPSESSPTN